MLLWQNGLKRWYSANFWCGLCVETVTVKNSQGKMHLDTRAYPLGLFVCFSKCSANHSECVLCDFVVNPEAGFA